jgi:hypothetical protein
VQPFSTPDTDSGRISVSECSSAPTRGVKPQVAVAIPLDSMVHLLERPQRRICHQRNVSEAISQPLKSHSGTSQQTSALVSARESIVNADEDERKSND